MNPIVTLILLMVQTVLGGNNHFQVHMNVKNGQDKQIVFYRAGYEFAVLGQGMLAAGAENNFQCANDGCPKNVAQTQVRIYMTYSSENEWTLFSSDYSSDIYQIKDKGFSKVITLSWDENGDNVQFIVYGKITEPYCCEDDENLYFSETGMNCPKGGTGELCSSMYGPWYISW